jgi:hypothetical protein
MLAGKLSAPFGTLQTFLQTGHAKQFALAFVNKV